MQKLFFTSFIIFFIVLAPIFSLNSQYIYAGTLSEEAASYREKGYKAQELGDIDIAISWYQKAINLDANYAAPHNDLGILFEAKGWLDRAEKEYQKAIAIDPNYEKSHTNLALLYERKGELEKAAFHWMRRYRLGKPNDPWTYEARRRLEKLGLLDETEKRKAKTSPKKFSRKIEKPVKKDSVKKQRDKKVSEWTRIGRRSEKKKEIAVAKKTAKRAIRPLETRERDLDRELQESLRLAEERLRKETAEKRGHGRAKKRSARKMRKGKTNDVRARSYYTKARNYYEKGEYSRALDTIRTAKKDYPEDPSLFKLERTIKNKMKEERIEDHYNEGIMRYHQQDFSGARKEFEAILNILPE